jgi:ribonuclease Z
MAASVQVLSTGADEGQAVGSLVLQLEQARCLFNCPEGAQRFCAEHGVRLGRATDVFLTHLSPRTLGGLPGMLMTLGDAGVAALALRGPPGLSAVIAQAQTFCEP